MRMGNSAIRTRVVLAVCLLLAVMARPGYAGLAGNADTTGGNATLGMIPGTSGGAAAKSGNRMPQLLRDIMAAKGLPMPETVGTEASAAVTARRTADTVNAADTTTPTGTIVINYGDPITISRWLLTLSLTWSDGSGSGVTGMRFSDDGVNWSAWETPNATRAYSIPAGLGYHTVWVQYLDVAGNMSPAYSDSIELVEPAAAKTETVLLPGNVPLDMLWIPGGTLLMGRYPGEYQSDSDEDPQHTVTLGGFWMAKYELTKRQYTAVMGTAPWTGQLYILDDLDSPAVYVSWNDAQSFLTSLNGYTGRKFRLPSEAEWEYACRAGTSTRFYWGDDSNYAFIGDYTWYYSNATYVGQSYAHVAGTKLPNAFGLYDMSGNVFEWCGDDWHGSYAGAPTDGQAWVNTPRSSDRVLRGGAYGSYVDLCRSATRGKGIPTYASSAVGFRVALTSTYAADLTAPTGTININNNRSATNSPNVTLSLTWNDGVSGSGVSRMRFSDNGAHWSLWEPVAATRAYTLPAGQDGHRTVRVQFLDKANNRSLVYSDYILLDTTPPTGTIIINGGASTTTSQSVTLGLTWSDGSGAGVSRMRFSDNGSNWTPWMPPETTHAHTLPAGLGYHTVRVQYVDGAGNYSAVYNDYIKLVGASAGRTER